MKDLSDILGLKAAPVDTRSEAPARPDPEAIADAFADAASHAGLVASEGGSPVRRVGFAVLLSLAACATASAPAGYVPDTPVAIELSPAERARAFSLDPPPVEATGADLRLWATHYHTPSVRPARADETAFPLLGRDATPISIPISHRDWCEAALQGSVSVREGSKATAYVFVDANGPEQADCDQWLGSLSDGVKNATRRARFMKVNHALGCGVRNHPLMPFRTIAVDPDVIPLESVIFVPELRGRAFTYEDRQYVHDGYLFAGDRGGAIKGRHIDVFLVEKAAGQLEDLFASHDGRTFAAHVISEDDPRAIAIRETQSSHCG